MSGGLVAFVSVTELAGLALRAGAPLFVAAFAVAVVSITLAAWTGIQEPAVTWLSRTTFVGIALFVGAGELWRLGEHLFERCLAPAEHATDLEHELGAPRAHAATDRGTVGRGRGWRDEPPAPPMEAGRDSTRDGVDVP